MFEKLNFPDYPFTIHRVENKFMIFDQLRKKYVRLTEEEWVRQHMISYIIYERKIPRGLIKIESGLRYEKLKKRTDILIYERTGLPHLMIECKSPAIKLNQEVLFQAGIYGKSLKVPFIGITNGLNHFFWRVDYEKGRTGMLEEFPDIE
jgi:type I site-specific restriction endonuclease